MVLDLREIQNPEPTSKMDIVIHNLWKYDFITGDEYNEAMYDYYKASELIDEHQEAMHEYLSIRCASKGARRSNNCYRDPGYYMDEMACDDWGIDASFFF